MSSITCYSKEKDKTEYSTSIPNVLLIYKRELFVKVRIHEAYILSVIMFVLRVIKNTTYTININ